LIQFSKAKGIRDCPQQLDRTCGHLGLMQDLE
jgi:hypothetical protein